MASNSNPNSGKSNQSLKRSKSSIDFLLNAPGQPDELPKLLAGTPSSSPALPKLTNILHRHVMQPDLVKKQLIQNFNRGIVKKTPSADSLPSGFRFSPSPNLVGQPRLQPYQPIVPYPSNQYRFHQPIASAEGRPQRPQGAQPDQLASPNDRQPQLKYSHKIAERKRRKDMNDTFDELRSVLNVQNVKMSKWEILMTASDSINELEAVKQDLSLERETLHRELGLPPKDLLSANKLTLGSS